MLSTLVVLLALVADPEVARVQHHLAGAETLLRAADVAALSPAQRGARAAVIEDLAAYRRRGQFPRNVDFAARTPYFIDDRGVRCAMAYLIERHGGAALVARVAATANNARVAELAADPELRAWLAAHGMTLVEAARVQPTYQRQVGWSCIQDAQCVSGRCMPALDHPDELSYCTAPCDPAAAAPCAVGMADAPMTCQLAVGGHLCLFPDQTPATSGWPCDLDREGFQCVGVCVGDRTSRDGTCAPTCVSDATCADGLECRTTYDREPKVCTLPADSQGCATTGAAPLALAALAPFVGVVVLRRRRRRGGRAAA